MVVSAGERFETEIVGESHYQSSIIRCVRSGSGYEEAGLRANADFDVRLIREPTNPYDVNAVIVASVTGATLGYLARDLAAEFAPVLDRLEGRAVVQCPARAYGRREDTASIWNFGIWIDVPEPDDLQEVLSTLTDEGVREMRSEDGLVRYRDGGSETRRRTPSKQQASSNLYSAAGEGGAGMIPVTCPACGSAQSAVAGPEGFRCNTCQRDVWSIRCHRCHKTVNLHGPIVGSGSVEFRCGHCRAKNAISKQSLRAISADVRRAAQAQATRDREAKAAERLSRVQRTLDRQAEADVLTLVAQETVRRLGSVLHDSSFDFGFADLKMAALELVFSPKTATHGTNAPELETFLPEEPKGFAALVPGARRKHQEKVKEAEAALHAAEDAHGRKERKRLADLQAERDAFEAETVERDAMVARQHAEIDELQAQFVAGQPDAIVAYSQAVLDAMPATEASLRVDSRVAYSPDSRQLVVELELPTLDVVPGNREYRYVKSRDDIKPSPLPAAERKRLYSSLVAQLALVTLRNAFSADQAGVISTIVLNGHVHTIDRRTGQNIHPCLITVRCTRERFEQINLAQVDPAECLKGLSASISKSPAEMVPVRPVVEFDMVDPRFVADENILGSLDTRANLMDLTPKEFESLITNLFEKMGLETRQTQPSRDGGVDCVAFDSRPIFGGKVVIQAKRYKNTVGVSAVRDLFGTMQNEGATKGILVTTSGYGQASHDFANNKPLELIDGGNLIYLLQEHAGIEAKIEVPEDWVDPALPA